MKRFFIFFVMIFLLCSQLAFAFEEKDGKVILTKEEFVTLDRYIRKLEEENRLLKKKIEILEKALGQYKEKTEKIEESLRAQLDTIREQFNKKQEEIVIYQLEIKKRDLEISKQKAQKVLFGILGIGFGYLISQIQK